MAEYYTLLRGVTEASPYVGAARETVGEVRSVEPPAGVRFFVGGLSAGQKDFISSVYDKAPYAAAFVLGVTYLVLLYTFRSVFIPLKAVAVNILSLTASFGALVFVFQDGNFSNVLNFAPLGFVDATLPILIFCTIFGVSMDYEVFLLSRIREAYENGDSNTASVAKGLASTAGIITSAAAIIIIVTGAFAFSSVIITKAHRPRASPWPFSWTPRSYAFSSSPPPCASSATGTGGPAAVRKPSARTRTVLLERPIEDRGGFDMRGQQGRQIHWSGYALQRVT